MFTLTEVEREALYRALDGPQPWMPFLRAQVAVLRVKDRRHTGVGSFVEFEQPLGVSPVPDELRKSVFAPSVEVAHPLLTHGGSFVVWVTDGFIDTLECVSNVGEWPQGEDSNEFTFQ
jgi:hypothetical protein